MLSKVGTGWNPSGSPEYVKEFNTFTSQLFPYLFAQDCEEELETFCNKARDKIEQIINEYKLESLGGVEQRLYNMMQPTYIRYAKNDSKEYTQKVQSWLESPIGKCGTSAANQLTAWGIEPPYRGLSAISKYGKNIYGMYFHSIKAVCVQLDVIAKEDPEVEFLLTLLHEEIHAAIHKEMGDDDDRKELTWLNELVAVLTSYAALRAIDKKTLNSNDEAKLVEALDRNLNTVNYGDIAKTALRDTSDPLVALKIWKHIFKLSPEDGRDYSLERIIKPIAHQYGWTI